MMRPASITFLGASDTVAGAKDLVQPSLAVEVANDGVRRLLE